LFAKHPSRVLDDAFSLVEAGANQAATGANALPHPTEAQAIAGNYPLGTVRLFDLPVIRIENVRGSFRWGTAPDGTEWHTRLAAHYGYFSGTRGADGDAIDVFVGPFPESESAWVINQRHVDGQSGFDEHKCMVGFHTKEQARDAYMHSFDRGWTGLASIVPVSINQLKWWLKFGNHKLPITAETLPFDGENTMLDKVLWDSNAQPVTSPLHRVMYDLRVNDADAGLMLDACTMADYMADPDIEAVPVYDALVVEVASMTRKMTLLQTTMESAGITVKPTEMTIADPVKARGVMQVMVLFSMSDGQTVSIWFHNPDTTPAKLTPMDELISWKWMINKKDVTIVVAPERGTDLNVREVSRRVMRLVEKNSEAFQKANAKAGERAANTEALKTEIVGLEGTLAGLQRQIELAKVSKDDAVANVSRQIMALQAKQDAAFKLLEAEKAFGAGADTVKLEELMNQYDDLADQIRVLRGEEVAGRTSWATWAALRAAEEARNAPMLFEIYREGNGEQGKVDSAYPTLGEMKDALDNMDTPAGAFYGRSVKTGDVIYSFRAETEILKASKRVTKAEFDKLMELALRWSNKELGQYSTDWLERNAPSYLALRHGIDKEWAGKAFTQWTLGDAGIDVPAEASQSGADGELDYSPDSGNPLVNIQAEYKYIDSGWSSAGVPFEFTAPSSPEKFTKMEDYVAKLAAMSGLASLGSVVFTKEEYSYKGVASKGIRNEGKVYVSGDDGRVYVRFSLLVNKPPMGGYTTKSSLLNSDGSPVYADGRAPVRSLKALIDALYKNATTTKFDKPMDGAMAVIARLAGKDIPADVDPTIQREMDDELTYARQGTYSPSYLAENRSGTLVDYFGANQTVSVAHKQALADAWESRTQTEGNTPIATVDAAYKFDNATDAFKEWIADSVPDVDYSPFASASAMDKKAKELGASVAWDVSFATLDSAKEEDEGEDFDPQAEFDAAPELDDEDKEVEPVMDGDFKNHPFRGNQHKKAARASGTAVNASIRAKSTERRGDAKSASKAHETAHHAHKAAFVEATGKAKKYHKVMAAFHGARAGLKLDSVEGLDGIEGAVLDDSANWHSKTMEAMKRKDDAALRFILKDATQAAEAGEKFGNPKSGQYRDEAHYASMEIQRRKKGGTQVMDSAEDDTPVFDWMLDDASEFPGTVIGVFTKDGVTAGRAHIGGDGKAMVFTGSEGMTRVEYAPGKTAMWSDDDAEAMVGWLLTPKAVEVAVSADNDTTRLNAADALVSKSPITSDDPQAIAKLDTKLTALRMRQEFMKKANKFFKKGDDAGLLAMGLTQGQINKMKGGDFAGRIGFADYLLTNNNGNMAAIRKRMDALIAAKQKEAAVPEVTPEVEQPVAPALVEPVAVPEPGVQPVEVDPIKAVDTAYLGTFIDGTADLFAADILDRLEPMFAKYESDATMMDLLNRAVEAYSDAALKVAQATLAG
jgi:hypothetical protein